ncbi:hypothetical protein FB45DRAFT_1030326 [Roridomyces roridus]|uniref:CxC2-like cysteine cluster KDZ transposase-associated domain-containing protein n=1 Tax=Roridomyces roridus TaxID=1738132 RepID=A0AAD7FIN2_9AGAR|nr:hypothetical protein FB45DRAFT_1030326 [Roridomyces roridus]
MPGRRDKDVHFEADVPHFVADAGIEFSVDGLRATTVLSNVRPQKRVRSAPKELGDDYANWTPVGGDDPAVEALADTISTLEMDGEGEESAKRKRYESSDDPMGVWRPHAQAFLDRMMRRHHIGSNPKCGPCGTAWSEGMHFFRCVDCGEYLACEECLWRGHELHPLHRIKEWTGMHWDDAQLCGTPGAAARTAAERREGKIPGVGLVYQLGHQGYPCSKPGPVRSLVVVDCLGVFTLDIRYCSCRPWEATSNVHQLLDNAWYPATVIDPGTCATFRALEHFRLLNVVGNISVHDYIGTLERLTDPIMAGRVPDRYKEFGRMTRQYNYLQQAVRTGWGQMNDGLSVITPGGMAVACWTCPHRDKNLPVGWENVHPRYRANERHNPALGQGQSYFVEAGAYKEHLRSYVAEKDVSSCIAFAALLQKDTRVTAGLRVSGVGGCVCARHGVLRPLGLGDLQKGERYSNMDYILLSALTGVSVLFLAISYNIACQWKVHLPARAENIVKTTPVATKLKDFSLPDGNSLSFAKGVGRTDGEGIERTWAVLNPAGYATKEMGEGARQDAIENKVDRLNFEKNVREGDLLSRKLIVALAERNKQVESFKEVNSTLAKDLREKWIQQIREWQRDHSKPNPYLLTITSGGVSEAGVLRELREEDAAEAPEGLAPPIATQTTAPAFLNAGLQLEEAQRRIRNELKGTTMVTADRFSQIQELRLSLSKKVRAYETLQDIFMPGVTALRREAEEARNPDLAPARVEYVKLWLPSELSVDQRRTGCRKGLAMMEARLREGQCADALKDLRARLHAQRFLITWRNTNAVGQKGSTRSATLIGRVGDRVARVAAKYRQARTALIALKGEGYAPQYKDLCQEDMSVGIEEESDAASWKKLSWLGAKKSRNEPSELKKGFSWIWTVAGGLQEEDEAALHDSVRVEWCKARARRDRWEEEVQLLREEMRRTMRMLRYLQQKWGEELDMRQGTGVEVAAGARAYGQRQIAIYQGIAEAFFAGWNRSMATAVKDAIRQAGTVYREILDGHGMDSAPTVGLDEIEEAETEGSGSGGGGNGNGNGGTSADK